MAIFRPGHVVGAISGNLGAVNFAQGKYGPYVRRRLTRSDKCTERQLSARANARNAHILWFNLTDEQRETWRATAAGMRRTNRLGIPRPISGKQLHFLVQVFMMPWELHVYKDPPQAKFTAPPFNVTASFVLPNTFTVDWDVEGLWTEYWPQWATARPVTGRRMRPVKHWRLTRLQKWPYYTVNLYTDFVNQWGVPQAGEYVYVLMRNWRIPETSLDGLRHNYLLPSQWVEVEAVVT